MSGMPRLLDAVFGVLVVIALISAASVALADDGCPTSASEISTDRPGVQ
jgi:hypothetical protein